ncbi:MAG: DUF2935 domain-containing protein [Halobacteriales archaeon]|nr:DUF2935 domain-containing protein [Halobacteriales archaeon]
MTTYRGEKQDVSAFRTYTRTGTDKVEPPYEKPVVLAELNNRNARDLVWADARFATDIMSEHALFFALLMPEEVAPDERKQALAFQDQFTKLRQRVAQEGPPSESDLRRYVASLRQEFDPLIAYKEENHRAQVKGDLRTLVWPLFFDHTRREAVRWVDRMENVAEGNVDLDRKEVVSFWGGIMDEHARFVAHLLDPDEYELIDKALNAGKVFRAIEHPGMGPVRAIGAAPGTVVKSLIDNPEIDAVMSAAETILDFKTDAARKIEAGRIRSIIDPRLADHVRREAIKFVDELRRVKER